MALPMTCIKLQVTNLARDYRLFSDFGENRI